MTRARLLTALLVLCAPAFATAALAQDQPADATQAASPGGGGDMGGAAATGEATTPPPAPTDQAAPPADSGSSSGPAKPISVSLLLGYGISFESKTKLPVNPWGLGFGLRAGYNIDKIYIGPRFVYYLGASTPTGLGKMTMNVWELSLEGGYDLEAAKGFVVRPMLGLGIASLVTSLKITGIPGGVAGAPSGSSSSTKFFLAPGVAALYDVADNIFIGADVRFEIITTSPAVKGLMLLANGGMRF